MVSPPALRDAPAVLKLRIQSPHVSHDKSTVRLVTVGFPLFVAARPLSLARRLVAALSALSFLVGVRGCCREALDSAKSEGPLGPALRGISSLHASSTRSRSPTIEELRHRLVPLGFARRFADADKTATSAGSSVGCHRSHLPPSSGGAGAFSMASDLPEPPRSSRRAACLTSESATSAAAA